MSEDAVHRLWPSVRFTATERRLVAFLLERPGQAVSQAELLREVWGYAPSAKSRTIQTTVQRVRAKIEPDPSKPQVLLNLRGRGYQLVPPGSRTSVEADAPVTRQALERRLAEWLGEDEDLVAWIRPSQRSTNVHRPPDPLHGRQVELETIGTWLNEGQRLITLLGPGGVGKSRLAIEASAGRSDYPGGIWFFDLSETRTAEEAGAVVARVLGIVRPPGQVEPLVQALSQVLLHRGRTLAIFDNFEQLDAMATQGLQTLLERVPHLQAIVTSRRRVGLAVERVLSVEGLPHDDALGLLTARIERVRGAPVTSDATPHLERIVQILEGNPLAVGMAAGRTRVLPLAVLAKRLADNLSLLSMTALHVPARHRSLRATLAWSWEFLGGAERSAMVRLAPFRAGFDLTTAERVLGPELDAMAIVSGLVDHSLLRTWRDSQGALRVGLFESARVYAREVSDPGISQEADTGLLNWALTFVSERRGDGPALLGELGNLREALRVAFRGRDLAVVELIRALLTVELGVGLIPDLGDLAARALADLPVSPSQAAELRATRATLFRVRKPEIARAEAERASELAAVGSAAWMDAAMVLVSGRFDDVRSERVVDLLERVLAVAREQGDEASQSRFLRIQALWARRDNAHAQALDLYREALRLAERSQGQLQQARICHALGDVYVQLQQPAQGQAFLERAETLYEASGYESGLHAAMESRVIFAALDGRAAEVLEDAERLAADAGRWAPTRDPALVYTNTTYFCLASDRPHRAAAWARKALDTCSPGSSAMAHSAGIVAFAAIGDLEAAEALAHESAAVKKAPRFQLFWSLALGHLDVARALHAAEPETASRWLQSARDRCAEVDALPVGADRANPNFHRALLEGAIARAEGERGRDA